MQNTLLSSAFLHSLLPKRLYNLAKTGFFLWRDLLYFIVKTTAYLFPLKNRICASSFSGTIYGDNTKCIVEKLHEIYPEIPIHWLMDVSADYELPEYVKGIRCFSDFSFIRRFWEYSTAKVIVDTHLLDSCFHKRKGQLFIETWHGGLGIKRIENDVDNFIIVHSHERKIANTVKEADLFISNSNHLTEIYKRAFGRTKNIWEIGYPKNDILVNITDEEVAHIRAKVRSAFLLAPDAVIITYAPTFRDSARTHGNFSMSPYSLDVSILDSFQELFGSNDCHLIRKLHPYIANFSNRFCWDDFRVHDGTRYPDMQELIIGSDVLISDYSSCIFDAALFSIPCFIFATDFDDYRKDRGVYYELEELPFPYAQNNEDLKVLVQNYSYADYREQWNIFSQKVGLHERGDSAIKIAKYIRDFCFKEKE